MPWFPEIRKTEVIPRSPWNDPETLAMRALDNACELLSVVAYLVYHAAWCVFCRIQETYSYPGSEDQRYWKFYVHHYMMIVANDFLAVQTCYKRVKDGQPAPMFNWDNIRCKILSFGHYWFG